MHADYPLPRMVASAAPRASRGAPGNHSRMSTRLTARGVRLKATHPVPLPADPSELPPSAIDGGGGVPGSAGRASRSCAAMRRMSSAVRRAATRATLPGAPHMKIEGGRAVRRLSPGARAHQRDSGAGSDLNVLQQHRPATTQAVARAVQFAPLFDDGLIKLTARAICEINHCYPYELELYAPTLRPPAVVSDIACTH